ncbi:serine protease [Nocardioides deserti]|nr:serine protease [Nocardioides deserti]
MGAPVVLSEWLRWPRSPRYLDPAFSAPGSSGSPVWPYQAAGSAVAGLEVSDATTDQSSGVVLVSAVVDFGAGEAAGSGMVVDGKDGIVVTNHHVVEGSTTVTVTDATTGGSYVADVLGTDAQHDVAVLRIEDAPTLAEVTLDTAPLAVGDLVTAVGDAGGDGGTLTAAAGTVTDTHEPVTVTEDDGTTATLRNLVEVDADIISGDSGGALLDADGEVVGMNVAASKGTTDITGYAIPARRVLRIVEAVLSEVASTDSLGYDPFLGVQLDTTSQGAGAAVAAVLDDGPAQTAGLTAGATITALSGAATPSADALVREVVGHEPGEVVEVTWTDAAGTSHTAEATLGRAPVA